MEKMNPYSRQGHNIHHGSEHLAQNTPKHLPIREMRPRPPFPPSFPTQQDNRYAFSQPRNPVRVPPDIPRQFSQRPPFRPKEPMGASAWSVPAPAPGGSSNPEILASAGRTITRLPPGASFGKELGRCPIREGGMSNNAHGPQQTGQWFSSFPSGFHEQVEHGLNYQHNMSGALPGAQQNNFRTPCTPGFPHRPPFGMNGSSSGMKETQGQPSFNKDYNATQSSHSGDTAVYPRHINNSVVGLHSQDKSSMLMPPPKEHTDTFQGNTFSQFSEKGHRPQSNLTTPSQSVQYQSGVAQPKNLEISPFGAKNISQSENSVQSRNEDQSWLMHWLKSKSFPKRSRSVTKTTKAVNISFPQARSLVTETTLLMGQLRCALEELKEDGLHEDTKREKLKHMEMLKIRLEEIKSTLNNTEVQNYISIKLEKTRKMRERKKRKRKLEFEARLEREVKRKQKHAEIDKWQQGIYSKIQDEKREKELKTIADKTLQEVTRKMTDINKGLQLLEALSKLREVRKDSMQRKGLYPPKDSGPVFDARLSIQKEALEKQKKVYEAEKGLLEVMLKTEQEESKEYEEQEMKRNKEEKEQEMEQVIREHLFGKETEPEPGDPMYAFWLFYNVASQSPEGLCAVREQWDYYLAREGSTTEGSALPSTWVLPSQPSSDVWASVLKS